MVMRAITLGVCYCFSSLLILLILMIICCCYSITNAQPSTANLSTTWTVNNSLLFFGTNGLNTQPTLVTHSADVTFMCGFVCTGNDCASYLFSVLMMPPYNQDYSQVVWSANRDHQVSDGSELSLTASGELVLRDVNGSKVWSSNTTGKSVAGLNLTREGNLVLFDTRNSVVWQSFDYPTDCLLPGQKLFQGQQLIPSVSTTDWTPQNGLFSLQVTEEGLFVCLGSNPPQPYLRILVVYGENRKETGRRYVEYLNGSLSLFIHSLEPEKLIRADEISVPNASLLTQAQYMKLMPDEQLQVFELVDGGWPPRWPVADPFSPPGPLNGDCSYPMACGRNSLCSDNLQCSCLVPDYFQAVNERQPNLGCSEITPLACNLPQDQELISVENVWYFISVADMEGVDIETCKKACVNNCSCKAALFSYNSDISDGDCFLPSELFTMMNIEPEKLSYRNRSSFIKVQKLRSDLSTTQIILISTCSSVAFVIGVVGSTIYIIRRRQRNAKMEEEYAEMEEETIRKMQGMPTWFAYENVKTATENFNKKLGEGGFGAVFEGTLEDGSKIAVKCLEGLGQVKKSFLAEVESIGSIHHVNLVRLRGFCAWKSQRFLVYEFMSNGSLDRWIYHGVRERVLEWKCRKKIILDVAKGLAYLHEECRQKIIHLDIKPQNILLDNDFNAKVSDFGLSKLIDRNQSEVIITLRGTPGYLAPEWLSSVITEKVDVYSFGIVLLETLCGRKKFDKSWPEDSWHLLDGFQKCWEQGTLLDLVDKDSVDIQSDSSDFVEMMKVTAWCLQYDFTKRPTMSMVVKVLEGVMKVESSLSYNFTYPILPNTSSEQYRDMTPLQASVLSGIQNISWMVFYFEPQLLSQDHHNLILNTNYHILCYGKVFIEKDFDEFH